MRRGLPRRAISQGTLRVRLAGAEADRHEGRSLDPIPQRSAATRVVLGRNRLRTHGGPGVGSILPLDGDSYIPSSLITANAAPCGSANVAKRPVLGMSVGGMK